MVGFSIWPPHIELQRGEYNAAIDRLHKWETELGTNATIENGLALSLFRTRRFEEALTHYRRAVDLDPETPTRNIGVLGALLMLKRHEEAEEMLSRVQDYMDNLDTLQTAWISSSAG